MIIGESGVSYLLPGAPFEFQFSYSETPKAKPIAIREPAFLPFAPPTMPRPWTGKAPLKSKKKKIPLFDSFNPPPAGTKGVKRVEMPGPFPMGQFPKEGKTREEILGEPLKRWEVQMLVKPMMADNRQVNLGRDGLTHNMLELVHSHWKRSRVCKVRCLGVPTVDMDNVCHHIEVRCPFSLSLIRNFVIANFLHQNVFPILIPSTNICTRLFLGMFSRNENTLGPVSSKDYFL